MKEFFRIWQQGFLTVISIVLALIGVVSILIFLDTILTLLFFSGVGFFEMTIFKQIGSVIGMLSFIFAAGLLGGE